MPIIYNIVEQTIGTRLAVQPDVCVENEATAYLNMVDVQKAFHARLVGNVKRWDSCSEYVWLTGIFFFQMKYQCILQFNR
jgi:hypothetical protein